MAAIRVPGGAQLTRKQIDEYGAFVNIYGAKGPAWLKVNDRAAGMEGVQSPIAKFLSADVLEAIWRAPMRRPAISCSSAPTASRLSPMQWARCV